MPENTILSVRNIVKTYPGVIAINHFSMDVREGEVHALIGENGAGKSTLIKTLSGAITPDEGTVCVCGKEFASMTPKLAKEQGIEVIYQEFTLVPGISAAENVFLGEKTKPGLFVDIKEREKRARELFDRLNVDIDVSKPVKNLSPAHQQLVEIAKAVSKQVKILIMDEPTAPLTVSEVETLFRIIKDLKSQGVTVIYISHRLEELFEIADRVTVMRDGCFVDTKDIAGIDRKQLISMMAGRELNESYPEKKCKIGEEVLRVEHLTGNGDTDISFNLRRGEILGFAGLVGAGRTELMRVIYGANPKEKGRIIVNGKEEKIISCQDAIRCGIGYIPEDRKNHGVFLRMSIKWNTVANNLKGYSNGLFVDKKREARAAEEYQDKFKIKTPNLDQLVGNLSGGNQQKVVIAKTLAANSKIIIFDEPTRGIDVGAKHEIYKLMNELAEAGHSIIMVSSDMPELLGMSDRIVVIYEGRKTGELPKEKFDQNYILDLASGGEENEKTKTSWIDLYKKYGIYIFLVVVCAFFSVAAPNFLSASNLINILRQVSMFGIVVIGVTMVMIGGGMDLSVGGQMAVVGMVVGFLLVKLKLPIPVTALIGILTGIAFGTVNGIVAIKLKIMPIIVTLSTMLILQGVAYLITGGYPITGMPKPFLMLGQGYIGPIPIPVIIFVLFILFGWIVMNKTYLGRMIYALGGNKEAARLAGINVDKLTIMVYAFAGFAASIAALIMVARTNASQPGAGSSYPFDCMTAACLGGISIAGGEGKISGAVIGVIIIGVLDNGLVLMGVNSNFQSVVKGIILLLAVAIDCYEAKSKKKA